MSRRYTLDRFEFQYYLIRYDDVCPEPLFKPNPLVDDRYWYLPLDL